DALDMRISVRHRFHKNDVVVASAEDIFNQREDFRIAVDDCDLLRTNDRCGSGRSPHAFYRSERLGLFGQHRGPSPRTLARNSGMVPPSKPGESLSFGDFSHTVSNPVRPM